MTEGADKRAVSGPAYRGPDRKDAIPTAFTPVYTDKAGAAAVSAMSMARGVATAVASDQLHRALDGEVGDPAALLDAIEALIDAKISDVLRTALSQPNGEGEGK